MYDIEIAEAKKLVDDTVQGAAAANLKADQAEQDLEREKAHRNNVSGSNEVERQQIDKLHRQIAENEAVSISLRTHRREEERRDALLIFRAANRAVSSPSR